MYISPVDKGQEHHLSHLKKLYKPKENRGQELHPLHNLKFKLVHMTSFFMDERHSLRVQGSLGLQPVHGNRSHKRRLYTDQQTNDDFPLPNRPRKKKQ